MKKYNSYKPSGIEWIGDIPEHWRFGKMKYVLSNNDGGVWGSDVQNDDEGTLVIRSTEITIDGNWDLSGVLKRILTDNEVLKCKLYEGDIVITKSSGSPQHIGKSVIVNKEIEELNCCYSNFVQRIRFRDYIPKLYHYILNSDVVRSQFKFLTTSTTGLGNLNGTSLNEVLLPFIPLPEQQQIVQFLDEKTEIIDKLISTKERKIDLLKDQRTSLINQVITKGLDPKVKMKDSGWIGDIPEHWKVGKLYQYGKLYSGSTPLRTEPTYWENGDIPWMSSGEINKKIIRDIDGRITKLGNEKSNTPLLPIHTVLMGLNGQGKTKGTVGILEVETTCNQSLCGIVFNKSIEPYYQYYYLETQYYHLRGLVGEGQREGISVSFLKRYPTIVPPIEEQKNIVHHINSRTKEIDDLVSMEQKKIDLLKEYRQSLISEVITGKIDVRTNLN
jgi:type I restriction enzyme S subunit